MTKQRRDQNKVHLFQPRWSAGFSEYRYGESKPVSLPKVSIQGKVARGKKRQALLDKLVTVMQDWRQTPFEREGASVAGLRSALCLEGNDWQPSNAEARSLVDDALRRIGAVRPTWDDGQRGYSVAKENCNRCGATIDPALAAAERRYSFCSELCARAAMVERDTVSVRYESRMNADAWDIIQRLRNNVSHCGWCDRSFRPVVGANNKFCSMECSSKAQVTRPERECKGCGEKFRPHTSDPSKGHYCSLACRQSGGFTTRYDRECQWCSKPFQARVPTAACCGSKCAVAYSSMKSGARIPKTISPPVFDFIFPRHPDPNRPRHATPQRFDWLLMEQGARITGEARIAA